MLCIKFVQNPNLKKKNSYLSRLVHLKVSVAQHSYFGTLLNSFVKFTAEITFDVSIKEQRAGVRY